MSRLFSNDQAITPDRQVRVVFDPDETICTRVGMGITRDASEIARGSQVGVGSSTNMDQTSGPWTLSKVQTDASNINELSLFQGLVIRAADLNIAVPYSEFPINRNATDIPGALPGGTTPTSFDWFIHKDFVQGTSAGGEFTADVTNFPKPPPCLPVSAGGFRSNSLPLMDRVVVGRKTQPDNCGYHLRFRILGTELHAPDTILAFYFGGMYPIPRAFPPISGGAFCLLIYGDGEAELWELTTVAGISKPQWGVRCKFNFSPPSQVAGRVHGITIQPHGRNTISFKIASASRTISSGRSATILPGHSGTPPTPHAARFDANTLVSGYTPDKIITGHGNVRMDIRRDLFFSWQVSILDYWDTGKLVDHEFALLCPIPAGTLMTLAANVIIPDKCTFDADMYSADDPGASTPLAKINVGANIWQFSSLKDKRHYFCAFTFNGDATNHSSPQLKRYSVQVDPEFKDRTGLNVVFPQDQTDELSIGISGVDENPSTETANIEIINQDGSLTLPRRRGRLKTRVDVAYVENQQVYVSYLFDGQSVAIERAPFGAAYDSLDINGIAKNASRYEGDFVGRWARGHESITGRMIQIADFSNAFDTKTGNAPARTVSEVIYDVFTNVAGVPPSMLDIPEFGVPYIGPEVSSKDAMLQPKQNPLEFILHLANDYLGAFLFFDRNAAPRGRWRIQPKLELTGFPDDPLCRFWFGPGIPGQGGTPAKLFDPVAPETYGDGSTWIERDSYDDWIEAPEYNFIHVIAVNMDDGYLPSEGGKTICEQFAWNPDSFDLFPDNPTANPDPDVNPDYVGEMLPLIVYDPAPTNGGQIDGGVQEYVNFLAAYLLQQYGHARKQFRYRAPLVLVKDPTDPLLVNPDGGQKRRHLRHNDPIWVGGLPAIVKRCDPEKPLSNDFQMCWITGVFKDVPLPTPS